MTSLTVSELKWIHSLIRLQITSPPLPSSTEAFGAESLSNKIAGMVAELAGEKARGPLVFQMRIPLSITRETAKGKVTRSLAPTLNVYGSMKPWQRAMLYKELDVRILAEMHKWPCCKLLKNQRPRAVQVTRFTSKRPDEIGVDVLGGKVPIDRLVQAGILMGDAGPQLVREAFWEPAPPGKGSLLVSVFDLT